MRIAIVDDEAYFLNQIKSTITSELEKAKILVDCVDCFSSADEFYNTWQPKAYHVIFLDIYLNEDNGVDIARKIRETDEDATLIFCTTSNEFAAQSYEVDAKYYLQKPLTEENVASMLKRVNFKHLEKTQSITLPDGKRILLGKILYTGYSNHYVEFVLDNADPYQVYMSHGDAEKLLLRSPNFCTINKGNIVNMNLVDHIDKNAFIMKNGEYLPISRRRFKEISDLYVEYQFKKMEEEL